MQETIETLGNLACLKTNKAQSVSTLGYPKSKIQNQKKSGELITRKLVSVSVPAFTKLHLPNFCHDFAKSALFMGISCVSIF